jgi:putative addiction module component (TIGR02574 family)
MDLNLEEIKKLPVKEKLKIIDEIWESIEEGWENEEAEEESPETIALLAERFEKYQSGETKFYSWEEVQERIKKNLEKQRNNSK